MSLITHIILAAVLTTLAVASASVPVVLGSLGLMVAAVLLGVIAIGSSSQPRGAGMTPQQVPLSMTVLRSTMTTSRSSRQANGIVPALVRRTQHVQGPTTSRLVISRGRSSCHRSLGQTSRST